MVPRNRMFFSLKVFRDPCATADGIVFVVVVVGVVGVVAVVVCME